MEAARPGAGSEVSYAISPVDETPIFYEQFAPPPGTIDELPPVVLTDGIGCDGYVWKYLLQQLRQHRRVIHWHYRGHGRTPPPRDPTRIGIPDLADDLAAVLADSETDGAVLCSHSMGIQVALECYRRHPGRVRGLILACGAAETPLKTFRGRSGFELVLPTVRRTVERAPRLFNQAARMLLPTRFAYQVATLLEINGDLLSLGDFMPYLRGMSKVELPFFLSMLAAAGEHSAVDLFPSIAVPVLVVVGERDGFTPPSLGHEMAEAIPDAELLVVEEGSHTAPLERPELVGHAIEDFLARRVDPGGASGAAMDRHQESA